MKKVLILMAVLASLTVAGCYFSEFSQSVELEENIDDYRTGCEIDADQLMEEYKQYDANRYYSPGYDETPRPTRTPSPITDTELTTSLMLERVWENGCSAGRRDAVGAEQATLMGLRDQLELLNQRLTALEPTPTPEPTPTADPTPAE